jgi:HSP20 family protein
MPNLDREFSLMPVGHQVRPSGRLWNPAADVYRSGDGWIVKVDLAGIDADDLEIALDVSSLRIRGCRRDTLYREGFICHQMEITYSRFEKRIQFPCVIDGASVGHDYHDGFLIINLSCK